MENTLDLMVAYAINGLNEIHVVVDIVDTAIPLLCKRYADPHSGHSDKTLSEITRSEYAGART